MKVRRVEAESEARTEIVAQDRGRYGTIAILPGRVQNFCAFVLQRSRMRELLRHREVKAAGALAARRARIIDGTQVARQSTRNKKEEQQQELHEGAVKSRRILGEGWIDATMKLIRKAWYCVLRNSVLP